MRDGEEYEERETVYRRGHAELPRVNFTRAFLWRYIAQREQRFPLFFFRKSRSQGIRRDNFNLTTARAPNTSPIGSRRHLTFVESSDANAYDFSRESLSLSLFVLFTSLISATFVVSNATIALGNSSQGSRMQIARRRIQKPEERDRRNPNVCLGACTRGIGGAVRI